MACVCWRPVWCALQPPRGMILCFAFLICSPRKDDRSEKTIMKLKQNGTNTREKTAKNICGHLIQENFEYIPGCFLMLP